MENRSFKVAGIKNLLRTNYDVSPSTIDVEAKVDDTLSMSENWYNNFKKEALLLCSKPNKELFEK